MIPFAGNWSSCAGKMDEEKGPVEGRRQNSGISPFFSSAFFIRVAKAWGDLHLDGIWMGFLWSFSVFKVTIHCESPFATLSNMGGV